ncbi:MAG: YncE family protein [Gemmatimonadales bacterium]
MTMRLAFWTLAVSLTVGALSTACGSSSTDTIVVAPPSVSLQSHDSVQLSVGVLDAKGQLLTAVPVSFHSSDTSVVVATALGWVRSIGPTGVAVVTVSGAGLATAVAVQVVAGSGGGGGGGQSYDTTALRRVRLGDAAFGVAASPGGTVYVTELSAARIALVRADSGTLVGNVNVGQVPTHVVFNPSGTRAYVSNQYSSSVSVIDTATRAIVDAVPVSGDPGPMAVSADGQALFVATNANVIYKIDLGTHAVLGSVSLPATSHHVAMNPSRSRLYVATRDGGTVMELSTATMQVLRTFATGGRSQGLVVTPDSAELWVANGGFVCLRPGPEHGRHQDRRQQLEPRDDRGDRPGDAHCRQDDSGGRYPAHRRLRAGDRQAAGRERRRVARHRAVAAPGHENRGRPR